MHATVAGGLDRKASARRLLVLAVLVLLVTATVSPAAALASAARTWKSGVFAGYGPAPDEQFGNWRGAPVQTATDYLESANWGQIEDPVWDIDEWQQAPQIQPVLTIPLWSNSGGSLSAAASGAYNVYFATMARNLVAAGLGSAILRLGWEFNGSWYPWSVATSAQAAQYTQAWRQIVGAIEAVRGESFGFDWSMTVNPWGVNPSLAYPGDGYVTSIGMDVYDWNERALNETPAERWNDLVNNGYGLEWQANFAAAHDKPISFAEWALVDDPNDPGAGGGDDPAFVQNMYDWFASHDTAFEDYFDADADGVDYAISGSNVDFPASSALYQSLYDGVGSSN